MKLCFISNYLNHHQIDFCDECSRLFGIENFTFIQTEAVPEFRKKLGYNDYSKFTYVIDFDSNKALALEKIDDSDIIINTQCLGTTYIKKFFKSNKLIFWYNERLFKRKGLIFFILQYIRVFGWFKKRHNPNIYSLTASSFGASDLRLISRSWKNRCYKWGYFPHEPGCFDKKTDERLSLVFVGRLIGWKHPEICVDIAEYLEKKHIKYDMTIIGSGKLEKSLKNSSVKKSLSNIHFIGSVNSSSVAQYYKMADILVFPSDRREGWGAVLNEGMVNACVPLANFYAGSSNYLIKNGENGYVYKTRKDLFDCLDKLVSLKRSNKLTEMGLKAKETIDSVWNGKEAARRFFQICTAKMEKADEPAYEDGPMAKEKI